MLELPEVEVLRKDLEKEIVGKRVRDVEVKTAAVVRPFHRTRPEFQKLLEGRRIEGVRRRGTALFLDLDEGLTWVVRAGPTASVHRETASHPAGSDTDVVITFNGGAALHITDPTKGESCHMGVVPTAEALQAAGVVETAIDLLDDSLTWLQFGELLRDPAAPLKSVLTDESLILGIGPVYSDEALFEAGLAHDRRSDTLSTQEIRRLYRAIQEVLQAAVKQRGATLDEVMSDDVFDEDGEPVGHLRVYGRDGQPCLRCRSTIVRTRLKGKTVTYHCERCQR